jgi:hypothetical protein
MKLVAERRLALRCFQDVDEDSGAIRDVIDVPREIVHSQFTIGGGGVNMERNKRPNCPTN